MLTTCPKRPAMAVAIAITVHWIPVTAMWQLMLCGGNQNCNKQQSACMLSCSCILLPALQCKEPIRNTWQYGIRVNVYWARSQAGALTETLLFLLLYMQCLIVHVCNRTMGEIGMRIIAKHGFRVEIEWEIQKMIQKYGLVAFPVGSQHMLSTGCDD